MHSMATLLFVSLFAHYICGKCPFPNHFRILRLSVRGSGARKLLF